MDVTDGVPSAPKPVSVVASCGGLCNQLRVVLSYRIAAQKAGRHLYVKWSVCTACPAIDFNSLLEPIEGVDVCDTLLDLPECYRFGRSPDMMITGYTASTHISVLGTPTETQMYNVLRPLPSLQAKVDETVRACGPQFIALHIRRTDHNFGNQTSDESFFAFVDANPELPIFLATDNSETQSQFTARYGSRLRVLEAIQTPSTNQPHLRRKSEVRHTPLDHAVVDLFTCVAATVFKGSYFSSFSDTIMRLRQARGCAHADDDHDLSTPMWHRPTPYDMSFIIDGADASGRVTTRKPPGAPPMPKLVMREPDPMADPMAVPRSWQ